MNQIIKEVIIYWDKNHFSVENLPNQLEMYSQIDLDGTLWSLKYLFETTPLHQGYESLSKVVFLMDEAPQHLLIKGFTFPFQNGGNTHGICEII